MEAEQSQASMSDMLREGFDATTRPLSERELDSLDAVWKPMGLLAAAIIGNMNNVTRYLEWRDTWNDYRGITYYEGDVYDDVD